MNATLCKTAEVKLDLYQKESRPLRTTQIAEMYATAPMEAIQPVIVTEPQPAIDEENLHNSFEEALSNRLTTLHGQWSHLSRGDLHVPTTDAYTIADPFSTESRNNDKPEARQSKHLAIQRGITTVCIAFMLFMIGFDLMGLLVLHLHSH
jgi:hypothetical protein